MPLCWDDASPPESQSWPKIFKFAGRRRRYWAFTHNIRRHVYISNTEVNQYLVKASARNEGGQAEDKLKSGVQVKKHGREKKRESESERGQTDRGHSRH